MPCNEASLADGASTSAGGMECVSAGGIAPTMRIIRSHEATWLRAEYGDGVRDRLQSLLPDIALALAIAVAAGSAASGASSDQPAQALLVALAFLATLSLAVRRLYPVHVLGVIAAATAFFTVVYDGYWPFAALVAFYSVAAHSRRRTALIAGVLALVLVGVPIAHLINWEHASWSKVALFAGRLAPLVAAWILGDNVRTRRAYLRAVEDRAAQLEREQETNARQAVLEEQARIAREIHDVVAHNLSVIIVQATAADAVFSKDPTDAQRAVRTIGSTARQALDELRRVLGVVRIGEERSPQFAPQPTLARLEVLVEQVRTAGLEVDLRIVGERPELSSALELSAYRIVQEALTNTLRHAKRDARHRPASVRPRCRRCRGVRRRYGADRR
jgi:signal transduction histidine kinase